MPFGHDQPEILVGDPMLGAGISTYSLVSGIDKCHDALLVEKIIIYSRKARARFEVIKWQEEFDFVVVDSAPVLAVVDALLIGKQCDAAILSVTRDKSRVAPIYETSERLRATRIPVLGCIFNGKQSSVFAPDYYAYGYSPAAAATEETSDDA